MVGVGNTRGVGERGGRKKNGMVWEEGRLGEIKNWKQIWRGDKKSKRGK